MPLTSPYNFVPINKHVYYPEWGKNVSMDIPFEDGEDGYIEVQFHNVSPLFTRNGARIERDKETESSFVIDEDGHKRYFIPGTTIKGMLRSTLEIMAFGKINEKQHYTNRWFGFRDIAQETAESKEYVRKVNQGKPGWLRKKGNQYFFKECDGGVDKISIEELRQRFNGYTDRDRTSIWKVNCSVEKDRNDNPVYPVYRKNNKEYRIVCSGAMGGKKNELLFPNQYKEDEIPLSKKTIEAFTTVYEHTSDFKKFLFALENGIEIPVFYLMADDMDFPVIGLSRMFRIPCMNSLTDMIRKEQDEQKQKPLDLCETMFGFAGDISSLRGRIQVGHAFAMSRLVDNQLIKVSGILGQPKASYYPLYVKQTTDPYKTYDTGTALSGRKIYRIHKSNSTTALPVNRRNQNTNTCFYALPPDVHFKLRINIHNLKKVEIGALLSALTLHETEGVYHNLGLAKSFGYGKIQIDSINLYLLDSSKDKLLLKNDAMDDYESAFENAMDEFLSAVQGKAVNWCDSKQMRMLIDILSEHNDNDVRLMTLRDYTHYKDTDHFEILQENGTSLVYSFIHE